MNRIAYPPVLDEDLVGFFVAQTNSGGGLVWDEVLEYRVWVHRGDDDDCFNVFQHCQDAIEFSSITEGAESPLALVLQREYIDEKEPGEYTHVREARITEWPIEFLSRPRRKETTIPDFLSPSAPANRLQILRGTEPKS
ncbi:MAG: GCN5 family acetyltransferase [Planctomycetota bacterium]